jgi:hypothetical protein
MSMPGKCLLWVDAVDKRFFEARISNIESKLQAEAQHWFKERNNSIIANAPLDGDFIDSIGQRQTLEIALFF